MMCRWSQRGALWQLTSRPKQPYVPYVRPVRTPGGACAPTEGTLACDPVRRRSHRDSNAPEGSRRPVLARLLPQLLARMGSKEAGLSFVQGKQIAALRLLLLLPTLLPSIP
jgi:hypothetical protein